MWRPQRMSAKWVTPKVRYTSCRREKTKFRRIRSSTCEKMSRRRAGSRAPMSWSKRVKRSLICRMSTTNIWALRKLAGRISTKYSLKSTCAAHYTGSTRWRQHKNGVQHPQQTVRDKSSSRVWPPKMLRIIQAFCLLTIFNHKIKRRSKRTSNKWISQKRHFMRLEILRTPGVCFKIRQCRTVRILVKLSWRIWLPREKTLQFRQTYRQTYHPIRMTST